MNVAATRRAHREQGMVLIISLLLLMVVTILALAMFRGVGLEGRIAGNVMDKQRALQAATSTEDYAEQWLLTNFSPGSPNGVLCSPATFNGATAPTICSNSLISLTGATSASTVPWDVGGTGNTNTLGYGYDPTNTGASGNSVLFPQSTTGGVNDYYGSPTLYIAYLGSGSSTFDYQIDAWSYGGSSATVAVVESVYQVRYNACAPPQCGL